MDGNTVEMDVERVAFAENALRMRFSIQKTADEYKDMLKLYRDMRPSGNRDYWQGGLGAATALDASLEDGSGVLAADSCFDGCLAVRCRGLAAQATRWSREAYPVSECPMARVCHWVGFSLSRSPVAGAGKA